MALCNITQSLLHVKHWGDLSQRTKTADDLFGWAEAHIQIATMTLTIKLDRNWNSFQPTNSAPSLIVTDSAIAPSARMPVNCEADSTIMPKSLFSTNLTWNHAFSVCTTSSSLGRVLCDVIAIDILVIGIFSEAN